MVEKSFCLKNQATKLKSLQINVCERVRKAEKLTYLYAAKKKGC
jgi:hypothetical protein